MFVFKRSLNENHHLFDFGDTLTVDLLQARGKMCDWQHLELVDGVFETLAHLFKSGLIYIATGAQDSSESDIHKAFNRVGFTILSVVFLQRKPRFNEKHAHFYPAIIRHLNVHSSQFYMVGDSLDQDIIPAANAAIKPIWLRGNADVSLPCEVRVINNLKQLCRYSLPT